jgi:virginiamycin B lyase
MQGTTRTIRRLRRLPLGALLIVLATAATSAAAAGGGQPIEGAWSTSFPERVHGTSVAVGPDGVPWFGLSVLEGETLSISHLGSGTPQIETLREAEAGYEYSTALRFDPSGALWFAVNRERSAAIARRDPDGTLSEFPLPGAEQVNALAIGPDGDVWFVRGGYGEKAAAQVGWMTAAGAVTQYPLEKGSHPTSIAFGPDGAPWFNEEGAGKIGRVAPGGEVRLFPLAPKVQPRQIVSGPDGALWFGENARARPYGKFSDRIGRITIDGQVSEMAVPFGKGTSRLVADPSGVIWFTTDEGEFSSISPSGNVGARGCVNGCSSIESLSLAPDGTLWYAAAVPYCAGCGGGSDLIIENEGTQVGEIPVGALRPADPHGPPAEDPYAKPPAKPPLPIARTGRAWGVIDGSAILTGYVNSRGFPTTWRFRWGRTKAYGHRGFFPEEPFGAGEGGSDVEEAIDGLCPRTTYHFEIVAYGSGGRISGGDRTFRTPPEKHPPKHCPGR